MINNDFPTTTTIIFTKTIAALKMNTSTYIFAPLNTDNSFLSPHKKKKKDSNMQKLICIQNKFSGFGLVSLFNGISTFMDI